MVMGIAFLFALETVVLARSNILDPISQDGSVYFLDSHQLDQRPEGIPERCSFRRPIHDFNVLGGSPDSPFDLVISPSYESKRTVISACEKHNISAVISDTFKGKYVIMSANSTLDGTRVPDDLEFLSELSDLIFVFSRNPISICPTRRMTISLLWYAFDLVAIVILSFFLRCRQTTVSKNFWFIKKGESDEILKEMNPETDRSVCIHNYNASEDLDQHTSFIIRLRRYEKICSFVVMSSLNLRNGNRLLIRWICEPKETPDNDFDATADGIVTDKPTVVFRSYRTSHPVDIEIKAQGGLQGTVSVPMPLLVPFHPSGLDVPNTMLLIEKLAELFDMDPFGRNNRDEMFEYFAVHNNASHVFIQLNTRLVYTYIDPSARVVEEKEILEIMANVDRTRHLYYDNTLMADGECFVQCLSIAGSALAIAVVVCFKQKMEDTVYRMSGIPMMVSSCMAIYSMSTQLLFCNWLDNILALLAKHERFFVEMSYDFSECYHIRTHANGQSTSNINDLKELIGDEEGASEAFRQFIIDHLDETGVMKHQIMKGFKGSPYKWFSVSAIHTNSDNTDVLTILLENITQLKRKEEEYNSFVNLVQQACQRLRVQKYTDFDSMAQMIGNESYIEMLKCDGNISFMKNRRCYAAHWNGSTGFTYEIGGVIERKWSQPNIDPAALFNTEMVVWGLDIETHKVIPLLDSPTIWDVLSVDRNSPIELFADFVEPEHRQKIKRNIEMTFSGEIDRWLEVFNITRVGGGYIMIQCMFLRQGNTIICLACDVSHIIQRGREYNNRYKRSGEKLEQFSAMVWTFTANSDVEFSTAFEPGISKQFVTNWEFIDKYVVKEDAEQLKELITKALRGNGSIDFCTTLMFERPVRVVFQGRVSQLSGELLGICFDVSDLSTQIHKSEKQPECVDPDLMNYVSNLIGLSDIIFSEATSPSQSIYTKLIGTLGNFLIGTYNQSTKDKILFNLQETLSSIVNPIFTAESKRSITFEHEQRGVFPDSIVSNQKNLCAVIVLILRAALTHNKHLKLRDSSLERGSVMRIELAIECDTSQIGMNMRNVITNICKTFDATFIFGPNEIGVRFSATEYTFAKPLISDLVVWTDNKTAKTQLMKYCNAYNINMINVSSEEALVAAVANTKTDIVIVDEHIQLTTFVPGKTTELLRISPTFNPRGKDLEGILIISRLKAALARIKRIGAIKETTSFRSYAHKEVINRRVLVVENDTIFQKVFCKMIESFQSQYIVVNSGEAAIDALNESTFDGIFMEAELPVMSGAATARMIRQMGKAWSSIPIIGLCSSETTRRQCIDAGMTVALTKPIHMHQISDVLRTTLRR